MTPVPFDAAWGPAVLPGTSQPTVHALPPDADAALCGLLLPGNLGAPWVLRPRDIVDCLGCLAALGRLSRAVIDSLFAEAEGRAEEAVRDGHPVGGCEPLMVTLQLLPQGPLVSEETRPIVAPRLASLIGALYRAYIAHYREVWSAMRRRASPHRWRLETEGARAVAGAAVSPQTLGALLGDLVLLWSCRHKGWWAPEARGYVSDAAEAGLYRQKDPYLLGAAKKPDNVVVPLASLCPRPPGGCEMLGGRRDGSREEGE